MARARPCGLRGRTLASASVAVAVPYALITTLVAGVAGGAGLRPSMISAFGGSLVLALASAAAGAARELPLPGSGDGPFRAVVAAAGAAGAVLLAGAALLAAAALAAHASDAAALARPAKAGAVGGFGLLLLQASLAPNAVIWSGAYLLGPGFSIGAGTLVSPGRAHLGDVPALPMLAALPSGGGPWPVHLLYLLPVAAGVVGGVVLLRRLATPPGPLRAARLAAGAGLAAGALVGIAAALSGGPVTSGRLATVGPSAWNNGLTAALLVGAPCVLTAAGLSWYRHRRHVPSRPGSLQPGWLRPGSLRPTSLRLPAKGGAFTWLSRVADVLRLPFRRPHSSAPGPDAPAELDISLWDTQPIPVIRLDESPVDLTKRPQSSGAPPDSDPDDSDPDDSDPDDGEPLDGETLELDDPHDGGTLDRDGPLDAEGGERVAVRVPESLPGADGEQPAGGRKRFRLRRPKVIKLPD